MIVCLNFDCISLSFEPSFLENYATYFEVVCIKKIFPVLFSSKNIVHEFLLNFDSFYVVKCTYWKNLESKLIYSYGLSIKVYEK